MRHRQGGAGKIRAFGLRPDYHCSQNATCLNPGILGVAENLRAAHRCPKRDGSVPSPNSPSMRRGSQRGPILDVSATALDVAKARLGERRHGRLAVRRCDYDPLYAPSLRRRARPRCIPLPHWKDRAAYVGQVTHAAVKLRIAATRRHGLALWVTACTAVQEPSMRHEMCPFYRMTRVPAVERGRMPRDGPGSPRPLDAAWCAHLFTPMTRFAATTVAGGWGKLRCNGDLDRCEVLPSKR